MKISGIITAAGCSNRMGRFKLGIEIKGRTILEYTLYGMYNTVDEIIVVAGCKMKEVRDILMPYDKVKIVENEHYRLGMFSSVKRGLLEANGEYIFITPGDCPLIEEDIYKTLLSSKDRIVIPSYKKRAGHPVLISAYTKDKILQEPDNSNLKAFINKNPVKYVEVNTWKILQDIDTEEDLKKIKESI